MMTEAIKAAKWAEALAPTHNLSPALQGGTATSTIAMEPTMETNSTSAPSGATKSDLIDISDALLEIGHGVDAIYLAAHALNDFERNAIQMITTECEARVAALQKTILGLLDQESFAQLGSKANG